MARTPKMRQEIGLYGIALGSAEKAKADLAKTVDMIHESNLSTSAARYRATEDLSRVADALRTAIANLEYAIRQAEDLDS